MTIKHTRKDIASEPGDIVLNLNKNTPELKSNNQNENFKDDLIITLRRQNQYNEVLPEDLISMESQGQALESNATEGQDLEPYNDQQTINIPLTQLVRLKYLQANYYTKNEIDTRVKVYIHVLDSESELPQQGQSNYIYLVPPEDDSGANQNYYNEFIWTDEDEYELVGSTQTDISGLLRKNELNSELLNADNFTDLQASVTAFNSHTHGIIKNDGTIPNGELGQVLTVGPNEKIIAANFVPTDSMITVQSPYNNIGSAGNLKLNSVLGSLNSTLGSINSSLSNLSLYLLKSEIYDEIWGSAGFRNLQIAEPNDSSNKTAKLGDYIYSQVYTKNDIDTLIGKLAQLQQQTLRIL